MDVGDLILYACAVVLVTIVSHACAVPISCEQVCLSLKDETSQIYKVCGCDVTTHNTRQISDSVLQDLLDILHGHRPHFHTRHTPKTTTETTTPTTTSTTVPTSTTHHTTADVCDVLCAAQLGGLACECSKPGTLLDELMALIRFFEKPPLHQVTSPPPTTTLEPTPDICHTLCKLQLGGHACYCSMPGFPGRK